MVEYEKVRLGIQKKDELEQGASPIDIKLVKRNIKELGKEEERVIHLMVFDIQTLRHLNWEISRYEIIIYYIPMILVFRENC